MLSSFIQIVETYESAENELVNVNITGKGEI